MQEEPQRDANPLIKQVAGHLFTFEEKIFGMSLTQLLTDIGVLTGSFSCTGSLPLLPRLLICALITLCAMLFVHGKIQGLSPGDWLSLLLRSKTLPTATIWSPIQSNQARRQKGEKWLPSVQANWIPLDTLQAGIGSKSSQQKQGERVRCWMALEIEGKNIRLLLESEQIRVFRRFEGFLTGLEFHLQFLSLTQQIDPQTAPALVLQKEALSTLSHTPHIQAFQKASLQAQEHQMTTCTQTRHFVIIAASSTEATLQHPDAAPPSVLSSVTRLLTFKKGVQVSRAQVLDHLRIRISVVRKAIQQVDMRIWPLEDEGLLQLFADCLAPGSTPPTFVPELVIPTLHTLQEQQQRPVLLPITPDAQAVSSKQQALRAPRTNTMGNASKQARSTYKKRMRGVHGTFFYTSPTARERYEAGLLEVADLLAPSAVTLSPDVLEIQAGVQTRYIRTFTVTGYGHHLLCGWINTLHDLGLPLLVSSHFEPVDSRFMIMKLEQALTKLESQRLSDQKTLRITRADQNVEAEQIRRVTRALASRKLKIVDVSMTICIHAGTRERLEQRSRYLLSHLRDMQIQARPALYQHDLAWQSCLPVGLDRLQHWVKLTSDVVSTMLPGTSGTVGTPTGVLLGYSGSGLARRPVYLNPWSTDKKILNPHMVVVGETGTGKTWTVLTLVTGLLGLGIADVCVLDRADDYLRLHQHFPGESQRYNLARRCPINLFDLPFGPQDVDPDDPADLLAEFFHHMLIHGLTLLVSDEDRALSKREDAYLIAVARATYACKGITSEAIRHDPHTLLLEPPTLADFLTTMKRLPASSESMQQSLVERLETASYLFEGGQTSVSLHTPLTIFSTKEVQSRWYPLMLYVVQNFLMRHRALKQDERYLSFVVEEASYLLKHPSGRQALEYGSREFRKYGIQLVTVSQNPRDFLEAGQVILSNAGTVCFLGMEQTAADLLNFPDELERIITQRIPGQCVLRVGNEYAPLTVWSNPVSRAIFTTDPVERRAMRQQASEQHTNTVSAHHAHTAPQKESSHERNLFLSHDRRDAHDPPVVDRSQARDQSPA